MPLNEFQLDALDSLTWLFDTSDSARRSGRTVALAVAAIRAACRNPGVPVHIFDHAMQGSRGIEYMMQTISSLVHSDWRLEPHLALTRESLTINLSRAVPNWLPPETYFQAEPVRHRGQAAGRRLRGRVDERIPNLNLDDVEEVLITSEPEVSEPEPEPLSKWERLLADDA